MSEAGYLALRKVLNGRRVALQLVNVLPYLLEGCVIKNDGWTPMVLLPAKAANLDAPNRLMRVPPEHQKIIIARAAAERLTGYRALTPSSVRFTADGFGLDRG